MLWKPVPAHLCLYSIDSKFQNIWNSLIYPYFLNLLYSLSGSTVAWPPVIGPLQPNSLGPLSKTQLCFHWQIYEGKLKRTSVCKLTSLHQEQMSTSKLAQFKTDSTSDQGPCQTRGKTTNSSQFQVHLGFMSMLDHILPETYTYWPLC